MTSTTVSLALIVAGILIALAMILLFFWKVAARFGPTHLPTAAKALREVYDPNWPSKLLGYVPRVDTDPEDEEKSA
jgi:hypothetical protein